MTLNVGRGQYLQGQGQGQGPVPAGAGARKELPGQDCVRQEKRGGGHG